MLTTQNPAYLFALFSPPKSEIYFHKRLQQSHFDLPTAHTVTYKNSFTAQAMNPWDSLPSSLNLLIDIDIFRLRLLEHIKSSDTCFTE